MDMRAELVQARAASAGEFCTSIVPIATDVLEIKIYVGPKFD